MSPPPSKKSRPNPQSAEDILAQKQLSAFILSDVYDAPHASVSDSVWAQLDAARVRNDQCLLRCIEFLGDARLYCGVSRLQRLLLPGQDQKTSTRKRNIICCNTSLLLVCQRMGIDHRRLEKIAKNNKCAGDAMEVFIELLYLSRPEAAQEWMAQIFGPLVLALESSKPKQRASKRKGKKAAKENRSQAQSSSQLATAAPSTSSASAAPPSTPFTYRHALQSRSLN
ncbi:hypothetical protein R3P38DRAFT_3221916 [Favolaschia claudopus]|uniref:RNase III domain-containing protein n=1 Tax=Favolaschia claudopus TaxID=2862362 RepID=A0AAV9ZZT9_9AGAR